MKPVNVFANIATAMPYKLYIDDLRMPVDNDFVVVRSVKDAIEHILKNGMPIFISFDHDLGEDENHNILPSGYDFAKWIVESDMSGLIKIDKSFTFEVHSQNPVGAKNIKMLLDSYFRHKSQSC